MSGDERTNGNAEALAFWEPRSNDSEPEMLVFKKQPASGSR